MTAAKWSIVHQGRKFLAATKREAAEIARELADATGLSVTVRPVRGSSKTAGRRSMKRNPDPGSFLPVWNEQEKGRRARLDYLAATKGRRLAKGLRGRDRGGAVKAHERGALKTAKFQVTAANRKETFKLGRSTRRQAEALADEFRAAGYDVRISEISP